MIGQVTDNHEQIKALLDKRLKEAEAKIIASPQFQFLKARNTHLLMEHGSGEICSCPDWTYEGFRRLNSKA